MHSNASVVWLLWYSPWSGQSMYCIWMMSLSSPLYRGHMVIRWCTITRIKDREKSKTNNSNQSRK